MINVPEMFGCMVFNDSVMKARLPKDTYKALKRTMDTGKHFKLDVANVVANAMKNWAIENGVTHYTHWFQPMTGITAEKHDSFITPTANGEVIMEFSGKELIKGEPDASSFPSGGLRSTFEARGYTAWDPTSYAFIKDRTLCIPTAFCSYSGEALDKKTPLLRSMEVINNSAKRALHLLGNDSVKHVNATVGPEQEYFLITKEVYEKRPDLISCGRTLFGARPPKGQEMDDHYFGTIKPRVSAYMRDLDHELWKLGVLAKTKHNEAAPAQHELAPIFSVTNISTDHNQLTMETMKTVADRHGLVCLLHEKPFAGVNGSGKHNNWSLSTDTGKNLFEPGKTPAHNVQFLFFLCAVIKAVDDYQELMRISVASAGNDHRLGANEAPPAIISMFLGDELSEILDSLKDKQDYEGKEQIFMDIGVSALPHIPTDSTDRNRTSPFAFTGNKFEFRMLGSSASIAESNTVINTIVSEVIDDFCNRLEKADDFNYALGHLIRKTIREHGRIIFNGNNYSDEWVAEAKKRGLANLTTTVDALGCYLEKKNIDVFTKHHVYTETEMHSRYEILLDNYIKTVHIEALTSIDMVRKEIIPAVISYQRELSSSIAAKKSICNADISTELEEQLLVRISKLGGCMYKKLEELENSVIESKNISDSMQIAKFYQESIFLNMQSLRGVVDELETLISKNVWPYPDYSDILYSVK